MAEVTWELPPIWGRPQKIELLEGHLEEKDPKLMETTICL